MLFYVYNMNYVNKVSRLDQNWKFDKFWVCQNNEIDNYPISK